VDEPLIDPGLMVQEGDTIEVLAVKHDLLIGDILRSEEELLSHHKTYIDSMVDICRKQMEALNEMQMPGSDTKMYISNMGATLRVRGRAWAFCSFSFQDQKGLIDSFQKQLCSFDFKLRTEEQMSLKFDQQNGGSAVQFASQPPPPMSGGVRTSAMRKVTGGGTGGASPGRRQRL
jgi:hypothetical protein